MSNEELRNCVVVTQEGKFVYILPNGKLIELDPDESPPPMAVMLSVGGAIYRIMGRN